MANRQGNLDEIQQVRDILRAAGLRSTPARIAVLQELRATTSPLTHAELADKLVPFGFDKTTVFRNLTDLAEADIVRRTELGDHVWRFEFRDAAAHDDGHPHFVCVECGSVTCLGDLEFTAASRKRSGEVGRITEILLKGHCSTCEAVEG
ncbi:Fur family transcriptional regulator [Planctomicrobium piriforme]|uniref:Fur family transcriptional regulator, ferric uptake regulator n=1 Tax=Planctomicrobium piriforme TaxID=1576369 RepID=A0A1I3AVQ1_9PLAN|nr:transcriptional repressor [Planctomicrobium piriforme]SFH53829.1 Fur family transcriptional regulator, ferric uptake regulator [Planctomicrobium piriforme]